MRPSTIIGALLTIIGIALIALMILGIASECDGGNGCDGDCPTPTPTSTATPTATATPTETPTPTPSPTASPTPSPTPPTCIDSSLAGDYIGEVYCVRVTSVHCSYLPGVSGRPTFCNDAPYPGHTFTALVWGDDRGNWSTPPEQLYDGRCVEFTGLVTSYDGKPQIELTGSSQASLCSSSRSSWPSYGRPRGQPYYDYYYGNYFNAGDFREYDDSYGYSR